VEFQNKIKFKKKKKKRRVVGGGGGGGAGGGLCLWVVTWPRTRIIFGQ
jgi:hypothetical protein